MNPEILIDKSPKELSIIKRQSLERLRFEDANLVQDYIDHCIISSRIVKEVLNS